MLQSALDFDDLTMLRPGWLVLGAGLIVVAVDVVRARFDRRRKPVRVYSGVRPAACVSRR